MRFNVKPINRPEKDIYKITIEARPHNWLTGTADGLPYAVKVCNEQSKHGIDNGRIIKLFLYAEDGEQEIAAYERGWIKYPTPKFEDSMDALISYCEKLPRTGNTS